jgi:site-specific recombinase XerD
MPSVAKTLCDQCGRRMGRASLVLDGKNLCLSCAGKVPLLPCIQCGGNTRMRNPDGKPFCRSCRTKGRVCAKCATPLPRASLMTSDGAVCRYCYRDYKEPQACEQCGQLDLFLNNIETSEGNRRVCSSCWRKSRGYVCCGVCRKNRPQAGQLDDGRPLCKDCFQSGGKPFVCPQCGQEGYRFSSKRCTACYDRERLAKKVRLSAILLRQNWAKEAWLAFGEELRARMPPEKAVMRLERYFVLFARLDAEFSRPSEITPEALLKTVGGRDGLRRFAVPYGFLVKCRAVPEMTRALLDDTAEQMRQYGLLSDISGQWYAPVLQRFHDNLLALHARYSDRGWKGKDSRLKLRTVTQYLRTAMTFCQMVDQQGVGMVQQITPNHLDAFQARHGGSKDSIRAFVRHLNRREKLFARLKVVTVRQDLPQGVFLSRDCYLALLKAWLTPSDETLREALAGLLMMLYAQPVNRVVALLLSDLIEDRDGRYRIALAKTEIALDPNVSAVLRRWLDLRKAIMPLDDVQTNPYLFPGRRYGEHITTAAVTYWLRKAGVTAEQLYSSAIYNAYRNGARMPKVLMNAFGITKTTAIKYLSLIDPRLTDEVGSEARAA